MNRKEFITKSIAAGVLSTSLSDLIKTSFSNKEKHTPIGFNHLPNKEIKTMNTILHKAYTRGHANHGWLDTYHTFSFANYYNPERIHFGVLRVLNDDRVSPGKGFATHPHDNMEIISIPLGGEIEHKDSMGNSGVIKAGEIQVMSAGTGIFHSEYNKRKDKELQFLQIWLFPNKRNVTPRYDQISIEDLKQPDELFQVLSPNPDDKGVWVYQNAWFNMGEFSINKSINYQLHNSNNGTYIFLLEGEAAIGDHILTKRDGLGIWDTDNISIEVKKGTKLLLMEVPMH